MSSVFSIFVQLFFGNFGGIRKKRGFRHRLVYKASRVFEETINIKGGGKNTVPFYIYPLLFIVGYIAVAVDRYVFT